MPTYRVMTSTYIPVTYLKLEREHNKYKTYFHSVQGFLLKIRKHRLYLKFGFRYDAILEQSEEDKIWGRGKRGGGNNNKLCTNFVFMQVIPVKY